MQPTTRTNDYHNNYYTTQLRNLQHTTILLTTNTPPEYYASLAPGFRPRDLAQVWPGDFARVWFPGFSLTALLSDWSGNIAPVHLNLGGLWWLPCRIIPGRVLILQREGYVVDFDFPLFFWPTCWEFVFLLVRYPFLDGGICPLVQAQAPCLETREA